MKVLQESKISPGRREALPRAMEGEQRGHRGRAGGKHKVRGKCSPLEGCYILSENERRILMVPCLALPSQAFPASGIRYCLPKPCLSPRLTLQGREDNQASKESC